jgi:chromosome segregation ATPase
MFFFNAKEDMGLNASLDLLDLSSGATIDDANQAYTYLHRMIDIFHRDNQAGQGDRQEDLELLACAYEKAVSYLSDPNPRITGDPAPLASGKVSDDARQTTDLHFTINFSGAGDDRAVAKDNLSIPQGSDEAVENAVAIISRRLQEAESALEQAREAVEKATAVMDAASQRLEKTKQDRINAMIAAKSARSRALLMEVEVKRATEEAIEVAEKVRDRVTAAKQAAKTAKSEADKAREQIRQVMRTEEAAAAEAVCAQDRLEKAQQQLKKLTHAVVEARSQLRIFQEYESQLRPPETWAENDSLPPFSDDPSVLSPPVDDFRDTRQQVLSDLLEIENALNGRRQEPQSARSNHLEAVNSPDQEGERRQHDRLYYPNAKRPMFSFNGRLIPILDLSQAGIGLESGSEVVQSRLFRGAIEFDDMPAMNVTGRVVRQDERCLGLRLVTRIGNHILDRERMRLNGLMGTG